MFYELVTQVVRWLLLPLLVAYIAFETIHYVVGAGGGALDFVVELAYDVGLLFVVFGVFLFVAGRAMRSRRFREAEDPRLHTDEAMEIRKRLERGEAPPLAEASPGDIRVFVSGHTHAPSLTQFGERGVLVNSGCWLRQLQRVPARLGAPPVFISRFVQTHVRVHRAPAGLEVGLWEHPRPARQRLLLAERLAVLGRLPSEPGEAEGPECAPSSSA
jgi:hypothetical protein